MMKGKWVCVVKFSHVPDLKDNLLSYFYFIYNKSFKFYILLYTISFRLEESGLFTATIELISLSSTVVYYKYTNIKKIIEYRLATRLILDLYAKLNPVCELYIARKILSNHFPLLVNHNHFLPIL